MGRRAFVTAAMAGVAAVVALAFVAPAPVRSQTLIDWSQARQLNVILTDDRFMPDKLTFRHGTPYQLHMENHGKELHEFTAPEFFAASIVRDGAMLANAGQDVVVQSGSTADIYLMPLKPGTYRLICADHDWAGMVGEITVE